MWDFRGLSLPEVNERVSPLVAASWLLPVDHAPVNHAWNVNPNVFTQFAERQRLEETRKTRYAEADEHRAWWGMKSRVVRTIEPILRFLM